MANGPRFIRFFWPIVDALREFGGSAQPRQVTDRVVEMVGISDDERAERTKGGALRVDNQVHWARNYLVWAGLLDGSQRGRWTLTPAGWNFPPGDQNHPAAYALFKRVREERRDEWGRTEAEVDEEDSDEPPEPLGPSDSEQTSLVDALRQVVLSLSPSGFEGLCKRLLTVR